ncbi:hypothetical protein HOLleu_37531 [Holothuria leucospilota]|uniref:Uncharacterized protein n=1 Tax=Holothuria leucospilota TaxID=206669 RepID=A0A9Q0YHH1_HOLLE|nr:hypothetical protein HOLleu_37531 [Holothuria leucospilota]
MLTGVTLPDYLPGEEPPIKQTNLSKQQWEVKELKVFIRALDTLLKYWEISQISCDSQGAEVP